jgi:formylglycine-generating enzyme required for sulfatase activity
VINVTWDYAQRYVAWLSKLTGKSYRLLSEAEWEFAARAGTQTAYSWGDEIGKGNANYNGWRTAPVGSFAPNAFGLDDMHGNVWEWVEDCYHDNYNGASANGLAWRTGDCSRRVVRGSSWLNDPEYLRSANRSWFDPNGRDNHLGFRVGRTLTP